MHIYLSKSEIKRVLIDITKNQVTENQIESLKTKPSH